MYNKIENLFLLPTKKKKNLFLLAIVTVPMRFRAAQAK